MKRSPRPSVHLLLWTLPLLFALVVCPLSAASPDNPKGKLDLHLRELIEAQTPSLPVGLAEFATSAGREDQIQVLVTGDLDEALLRSLGVEPATVLSSVATAWVPVSRILDLASSPRVQQVASAHAMSLLLDVNMLETDVETMWGSESPLYPQGGFTGAGVIVGIVDTGIDWTHADFKNSNNTTRIYSLWDQSQLIGTRPQGFPYGAEFTSQQINNNECISHDNNGHGTYLAGAAAGNGRATGNGRPPYQFVGMAPEATLVVVKAGGSTGLFSDANVIDGVAYVFKKADLLGKSAVVCIGSGTQRGPHDGKAPLDVALDSLSRSGRIIVAAAGNDGQTKIHSALTLGKDAAGVTSLRVPAHTTSASYGEYVALHGWFDQTSNFKVKVITPRGYSLGPAVEGSSLVQDTADGRVTIYMPASASGPQSVEIEVLANGISSTPLKNGDWQIQVTAVGTPAGPIDFWITEYVVGGQKPTMELGQSGAKCIASPASATKVIAATAYSAKTTWVSVNGGTYSFPGTLHDIADFSSQGPRRDGYQKPDIAASGNGLAAALNTQISVPPSLKANDGVHYMKYGTSTAAAVTAGAVALLLDETSNLDPVGVKNALRIRATTDSYTGVVPNARWGYGKLSVAPPGASVDAGDPAVGPLAFRAPYPNPTAGAASFEFSLAPEDLVATGTGVALRIVDARGRQVAAISGAVVPGNQRLIWDGRASSGQMAPAGLYFARLEVGSTSLVKKFVRIQ